MFLQCSISMRSRSLRAGLVLIPRQIIALVLFLIVSCCMLSGNNACISDEQQQHYYVHNYFKKSIGNSPRHFFVSAFKSVSPTDGSGGGNESTTIIEDKKETDGTRPASELVLCPVTSSTSSTTSSGSTTGPDATALVRSSDGSTKEQNKLATKLIQRLNKKIILIFSLLIWTVVSTYSLFPTGPHGNNTIFSTTRYSGFSEKIAASPVVMLFSSMTVLLAQQMLFLPITQRANMMSKNADQNLFSNNIFPMSRQRGISSFVRNSNGAVMLGLGVLLNNIDVAAADNQQAMREQYRRAMIEQEAEKRRLTEKPGQGSTGGSFSASPPFPHGFSKLSKARDTPKDEEKLGKLNTRFHVLSKTRTSPNNEDKINEMNAKSQDEMNAKHDDNKRKYQIEKSAKTNPGLARYKAAMQAQAAQREDSSRPENPRRKVPKEETGLRLFKTAEKFQKSASGLSQCLTNLKMFFRQLQCTMVPASHEAAYLSDKKLSKTVEFKNSTLGDLSMQIEQYWDLINDVEDQFSTFKRTEKSFKTQISEALFPGNNKGEERKTAELDLNPGHPGILSFFGIDNYYAHYKSGGKTNAKKEGQKQEDGTTKKGSNSGGGTKTEEHSLREQKKQERLIEFITSDQDRCEIEACFKLTQDKFAQLLGTLLSQFPVISSALNNFEGLANDIQTLASDTFLLADQGRRGRIELEKFLTHRCSFLLSHKTENQHREIEVDSGVISVKKEENTNNGGSSINPHTIPNFISQLERFLTSAEIEFKFQSIFHASRRITLAKSAIIKHNSGEEQSANYNEKRVL